MGKGCEEQVVRLQAMTDGQFSHTLTHVSDEVRRRWPVLSELIDTVVRQVAEQRGGMPDVVGKPEVQK